MGVEVEAAGAVVGTEVVELAAGLQGASSPSKRTIRTFRSIMPRSIGSSIPRWTVSCAADALEERVEADEMQASQSLRTEATPLLRVRHTPQAEGEGAGEVEEVAVRPIPLVDEEEAVWVLRPRHPLRAVRAHSKTRPDLRATVHPSPGWASGRARGGTCPAQELGRPCASPRLDGASGREKSFGEGERARRCL